MITDQILAMLVSERDKLNTAIAALQGSNAPATKRRGRRRKSDTGASAEVTTTNPSRKKRSFTPAQRKAQAKRMREYWAAKRKPAKKAA